MEQNEQYEGEEEIDKIDSKLDYDLLVYKQVDRCLRAGTNAQGSTLHIAAVNQLVSLLKPQMDKAYWQQLDQIESSAKFKRERGDAPTAVNSAYATAKFELAMKLMAALGMTPEKIMEEVEQV